MLWSLPTQTTSEWMCAASNDLVNIQRVRPDLPFKAGSNLSDDMKMVLPGPETTLNLGVYQVPMCLMEKKKKLCKREKISFLPLLTQAVLCSGLAISKFR